MLIIHMYNIHMYSYTNVLKSKTDLNVVLHKRVKSFPAETFCQFFSSNRAVAKLQLVKDSLQRQGNAPLCIVTFSWHLVHGFPQLLYHKQKKYLK